MIRLLVTWQDLLVRRAIQTQSLNLASLGAGSVSMVEHRDSSGSSGLKERPLRCPELQGDDLPVD